MNQSEFIKRIAPLRQTLLRKAYQLTEGDDSAEDIVQDVMLSLWNMRDKLDTVDSHEALAMTMVRNKFTDKWRRRGLEQASRKEYDEETAENNYEWKDQAELVKHIIDNLPHLQSTIMRMKEVEGYENEDIAQIMGCSADNVRQNLSRARRKVREEFIRLTLKRV